MLRSLVVLAALLAIPVPAWAFWPTTKLTAQEIAEKQFPIEVTLTDLGDGSVEVRYTVTPAHQLRTLIAMRAFARDGDKLLFQFRLSEEVAVVRGLPDQPAELSAPLSGSFRVGKGTLAKTFLTIDCPVEPLNLSGQTYLIPLVTFRKP